MCMASQYLLVFPSCVSMKNLLVCLFLFLSGVYARHELLARSLWNQFDTIFGSSLHHIFATEEALQNAYDFTNNSSASSKALHYSCATYKDGSNIGKQYDNQWNVLLSNLSPTNLLHTIFQHRKFRSQTSRKRCCRC